jgi:hypothetical protein
MYLLSPPAWKIVGLIARDDLVRQSDETDPLQMLDRDVFKETGVDASRTAGSEERSGLTVVPSSSVKGTSANWTHLSLAQICGGVVDRAKRRIRNRGTGLAKSTAVAAINEAVKLRILKKRKLKSEKGDLPTGYCVDWKRVTELAAESKRWSNVKTTNKFGRPLPAKRIPPDKISS